MASPDGLEGHQQPLDPLGGEIVAARVGQHRQPACGVDGLDGLPIPGHSAGT